MKLGWKEAWAVALPYLVAVGACYVFGYWGAVGINVLEFVGFADLAKLAVYPLLASIVFVLAGTLLAEIALSRHLPPGGGANTAAGRIGRKYWRWLLAGVITAAVLVATFGPEPGKWFVVAMLVTTLFTPLTHVEWIIDLLPNPRIRSSVLYLVVLLPCLSFAYGRLEAHLALSNVSAKSVDVARSKLPLASDPKSPVVYLGLLGTTYVLREGKSGQIVLVKQKDDSPLFIVIPRGG